MASWGIGNCSSLQPKKATNEINSKIITNIELIDILIRVKKSKAIVNFYYCRYYKS